MKTWDSTRFAGLLARGIAAAKAGEHDEAQEFLRAASRLNPMDPRPWLWLSSTTEDADEKRTFLEEVLAIEPTNVAARRGLALLKGYIPAQPTAKSPAPRRLAREIIQASVRTFSCPNCGGLLKYDPRSGEKRCERCGTVRPLPQVDASSEAHERPLDFVLPTESARRGARTRHAVTCRSCGAGELLPPGNLTMECAFCGSDQLLSSPEIAALLEPQGIIPMQIEEREAQERVRAWLGKGIFTPRKLSTLAKRVRLRPAYYPVWSFDSSYNARWMAMVKVSDRWVRREGSKILFFDDLLVPGTSKLPLDALKASEPFDLASLVEYHEGMLAGWPALVYDCSLADASIVARGEMARVAREELEDRVLIDKEKRDFKVIPNGHSDQSYRQLLVPLWVGHYTFEGRTFDIYVNGQSGKVAGKKPRDTMRVALAILFALVAAGIVLLLAFYLLP